jgi:hypothetical protein
MKPVAGSLALALADQHGRNYFNVFLDGDLAAPLAALVRKKMGW